MYQLTVKDLQGNILHQPNFETLEEAQAMQDDILTFRDYHFPAHEDEQGNLVADFTVEIQDVTTKVQQDKINADALLYLSSTDWYVTRSIENADKPIPEDIKIARQAARDRIVK